ncbi:MAG: peptide chain release factor N(5)-glutamine methyltransferase [Clostridia bacterium]|nr:peptide chain release factor N(5)-glutamine methyltransferase [Clostridia bacterium]
MQLNKIDNPRLEAEVLLAWLLGCDRVWLYAHSEEETELADEYRKLLDRRIKGEPVAYLLGKREFMGLDLEVNPAVLIPRPETELLVEKALAFCANKGAIKAADVGTGSGAIALSLAFYAPEVQVWGLDISAAALAVAERNRKKLGLEERVNLQKNDLLTDWPEDCQLDLVLANLPYIPSQQMAGLMRDVRDFEPVLALDGGSDGLQLYRRLRPQAEKLLRPGGLLLLEIMSGQGAILTREANSNWTVGVDLDWAGQERIFWGIKK